VVVPPPGYHARLKSLAERHGILLVADEIQTGMGRTGRMFAMEHWDVVPDLVCIAKGVASGLPLGALVASASVMTWGKGAHASTFGGNPLSCVAALETIRLLEGGLVENARKVGDRLLAGLRSLRDREERVGLVDGRGLFVGVEFVRDRATRVPDPDLRDRVLQGCFQKGLLLMPCGASRVRFSPPLVVTSRHADTAVNIVAEVLKGI
jgi:4-aminobutyrate aminotransferase